MNRSQKREFAFKLLYQIEVQKEPKKALDGGKTGLDFYERILDEARDYLNEDGVILFEVGYDQAKDWLEASFHAKDWEALAAAKM